MKNNINTEIKTRIVIDSCCDLPLSYIEDNKDYLEVIGMPVYIDGFEYYDDLGKTFTHDKFYKKLRLGIMPSTSQINSYRFSEIFTKNLEENKSIIYIGFSAGLSGTFNSALAAVDLVLGNYPKPKIRLINTVSASVGQGLLIMKAIEMLKNNESDDSICNWLEENKLSSSHWFAVDDLMYLKNGGRISVTSAVVGTLLSVKPILTVNRNGKLEPYSKVKGRKKSIKFLIDKFKKEYDKNKYEKVIIGHGNAKDDAEILRKSLLKEIHEENIIVTELSATIASHVGPGMLALAYMSVNDRVV